MSRNSSSNASSTFDVKITFDPPKDDDDGGCNDRAVLKKPNPTLSGGAALKIPVGV